MIARRLSLGVVIALVALAATTRGADLESHWPQWRGPLATGVAPSADPPIEWGEDRNVRWKVELPGKGHSTPIVHGDRIFLTTAIPLGDSLRQSSAGHAGGHDNVPVTHRQGFAVLALDRKDGSVLWQRTVHEQVPVEGGHQTASFASGSPTTDGERVFAFFGSHGLFALEMDGKVAWQVDFGQMRTKHGHGEGSSPVLHGNHLVVNWDHEGASFLVNVDKLSGEERWRVARDEVTSWATPIVVEVDGRAQLIVSGTERIRGHDLETGEEIWSCGGLSANVVASPVSGQGLVFAGSSYDTRALMAIRLAGAKGDLTGSDHVVWTKDRNTPYVPSPLLYGEALYFLRHYQGILTRLDASTGAETPGAFRLPGIRNVYASPVAAAGRIYITDLSGTTLVLSADDEPRVLSLNHLDDRFSASAAIAGGEIYLRGERYLYSLSR